MEHQTAIEFTAVLADDELSVLEGVKTAIDWKSLGIRIAALPLTAMTPWMPLSNISRILPLLIFVCPTLRELM